MLEFSYHGVNTSERFDEAQQSPFEAGDAACDKFCHGEKACTDDCKANAGFFIRCDCDK
ncbi:MAG: hypothetical protein FWC40_07240 [Proteobacteria bacterium]|nr:hypothetical protein [Pseudomonadota bacterium]